MILSSFSILSSFQLYLSLLYLWFCQYYDCLYSIWLYNQFFQDQYRFLFSQCPPFLLSSSQFPSSLASWSSPSSSLLSNLCPLTHLIKTCGVFLLMPSPCFKQMSNASDCSDYQLYAQGLGYQLGLALRFVLGLLSVEFLAIRYSLDNLRPFYWAFLRVMFSLRLESSLMALFQLPCQFSSPYLSLPWVISSWQSYLPTQSMPVQQPTQCMPITPQLYPQMTIESAMKTTTAAREMPILPSLCSPVLDIRMESRMQPRQNSTSKRHTEQWVSRFLQGLYTMVIRMDRIDRVVIIANMKFWQFEQQENKMASRSFLKQRIGDSIRPNMLVDFGFKLATQHLYSSKQASSFEYCYSLNTMACRFLRNSMTPSPTGQQTPSTTKTMAKILEAQWIPCLALRSRVWQKANSIRYRYMTQRKSLKQFHRMRFRTVFIVVCTFDGRLAGGDERLVGGVADWDYYDFLHSVSDFQCSFLSIFQLPYSLLAFCSN